MLLTSSIFLLTSFPSFAAKITRIDVSGNTRLDSESIIMMLPARTGDDITTPRLNSIIKALQKSGYFENVDATINGATLKISVSETPIVGRITVEGNSDISTEDIKKEIRLQERSPFSIAVVGADVQRILTIYQRQGFFETRVEPQKIASDKGRVDVVYKVSEGWKTKIREISFEGNKEFSDRTLRGVVLSKEYAWWKFMASFDTYDSDRVDYDMQLVRQFYLNNGYVDVNVSKVYGRLSDDRRDFKVRFKIEEGKRYKFGAVEIANPFDDVEMKDLREGLQTETGDWYSLEKVENTINALRSIVAQKGYAFIQVDLDPKKNDVSLTIDLNFKIKKTQRMYLNEVSISGNSRTFDSVINQHMTMKPKDPFSLQTIEQSRQRLMRTQYFKSVDMVPTRIEDTNLMNLDVRVQEQPTGELSGGVGWSNVNGFMVDAGITERNFMGRGQIVSVKAQIAQFQDQVAFSFTEPFLFGRALSGGFDVNYMIYDYSKLGSYGYNRDTMGASTRLGWMLTDNWTQQLRLSGMWDTITDVEQHDYDATLYTIGTTLRYDKRNTDFKQNTHKGIVSTMTLAYTGFGGTEEFLREDFSLIGLYNFLENRWQLKSTLDAGYIYPLRNDYVSRPYRYFLGGENMRGFDNAGIGSRSILNRNYAFGGLWKINGTTQLNFPIFIPDEYQVKGFVFADYGVLGKPPRKDWKTLGVVDNFIDNDLRASYGFGIYWNTPMGPINFSWGYPILRKDYDHERRFLLSFETQF
ncbi:MAG: outer membrane protein assembly factor BamA [Rickettsiales bacterium]|nr:outer membrane protein assembly factor BamA [Rickettsiales bacterium]